MSKNIYKKQIGGSESVQVCEQSVDVSQYKNPCTSLPLDSNLSQVGGNCSSSGTDCLGNSVIQLGQSQIDPQYPLANNMSEQAFEARYFAGKNAYGGGYYPAVQNKKIGGLPEIVSYPDCNKPIDSPKEFGNIVKLNLQGGGYNKIVNPITGRKVSIFGKLGKKILKNYLMFGGDGESYVNDAHIGEISNFDANMTNRNFNCKQPSWSVNCI